MEEQEVQVKDVGEINPDVVTPEQKEAAVINDAVDKGEVAEEYKVKEEDGVYKIDLDNPPNQPKEVKSKPNKDAIRGETTDSVQDTGEKGSESGEKAELALRGQSNKEDKTPETKEEVLEKTEDSTSDSPLELITDDEEPTKKVEKVAETPAAEIQENIQEEPKQVLPENVDKLVKFMEETGGSVEDYVNLNKDLSKMDNTTLQNNKTSFRCR